MNTLACEQDILITLCLQEFPIEIIRIITKFLLISEPPKLIKQYEETSFTPILLRVQNFFVKMVEAPFYLRDITKILSKYKKWEIITEYDVGKIQLIQRILCRSKYFKIEYDNFHDASYEFCRDLANSIKLASSPIEELVLAYNFACS